MAEIGVRGGINELQATVVAAAEMTQVANQLSAEATRLREQAVGSVDSAIAQATDQLITASAEGILTPRESLEAALDINRYKPSRAPQPDPLDAAGILDAFDRLSESDTPHIIPSYREPLYLGISSGMDIAVEITKAKGIYGLPNAHITFGSFAVSGEVENPVIAAETELRTLSMRGFDESVIGTTAIQKYLDAQKVRIDEFACRHGYNSNEGEVSRALKAAQHLASVAGFSLDTTVIDAELKKADNRRLEQERMQALRARVRRTRRHVRLR